MKVRPYRSPPKLSATARKAAGSRTEVAAELLRLEFTRERLKRDSDSLSHRLDRTRQDLRETDLRIARLQATLALEALPGDMPAAPLTVTVPVTVSIPAPSGRKMRTA